MKIVVVGSGYVGLVTGACLSDVGMNVVCVDVDERKIENLKNNILPIYEPGLEEIVEKNASKNRLSFSTSLQDSIEDADAIFIAVGTPPGEDGSADLQYVLQVAKEIGQHIKKYAVIITKSTVPVGTSYKVREAIKKAILERNGETVDFDIASNPEFLKEGAAIKDFMSPDRIVVGIENNKAKAIMERIYQPFLLNGFRMIFMDIASAELTKYAANAMLATRISFMNDIANLCEKVGANINSIRAGIGSDPRIGNKFLYAGIGYGGSCFPKDVQALIKIAEDNEMQLSILNAVEDINSRQKMILFNKLNKIFNHDLTNKRIAIWGLAFKPQTDDMREAPSLYIIDALQKAGAQVIAFDPVAINEAKKVIKGRVIFAQDEYEAVENADALLLLTEWREFRSPNWKKISTLMRQHHLLDGRNIYANDQIIAELGFNYYGIGF